MCCAIPLYRTHVNDCHQKSKSYRQIGDYQGLEEVAACNLPHRPRFLFGHKKEGDLEHLF